MKKIVAAILLVTVLALTWVVPVSAHSTGGSTPTSSSWGSYWATSFYYKIGSGTVVAQLIAGKKGQVGTVTVWESSGDINVQYDLFDGWDFTQTALCIGNGNTYIQARNKIPKDKWGNFKPDIFPNKTTTENPAVYNIDESTLGSGKWMCIAAYAEVQNTTDLTTGKAWGDLVPVGAWKLPSGPITVQSLGVPGTNIHWMDIVLSDIKGTGYSISNGTYSGWCADENAPIDGAEYKARVYSSLNLWGAPKSIRNIQWDMVNYILNHHDPFADEDTIETVTGDVQFAIWYFTNNLSYDEQTDGAKALIDAALESGEDFVPGPGQIAALILDPCEKTSDKVQNLIIELNAPTKCYKDYSWRHDCTPGWSGSQNDWEHCTSSTQHQWNPNSNNCPSNTVHHTDFKWDSSCTPFQNLYNYCHSHK